MGIYKDGKRVDVNDLLDHLIEQHKLKNDAALSRFLEVKPPVISKLRHRKMALGATLMVRIHEVTGMSIRDIKAAAGHQDTDRA